MKHVLRGTRWTKPTALTAAALCLAASAVRAQTVVGYSTNFNSQDTFNGAPAAGFTAYTSDTNAQIQNLAGQNGWGTTDPTGMLGGTQVNGGTNYVGTLGSFFGGTFAGAIGGNQRNTTPETAFPDVVPAATSAGLVSLYHAIPTGATSLVLSLDFVITQTPDFINRDTFAFSLRNAAGTKSLISINFVPAPDVAGTPSQDNVTVSAGTTANVGTGSGVIYNSPYNLRLTINPGSSPQFTATITDPANNVVAGSFGGSIAGGGLTLQDVGRFSADLSLFDKGTTQNGGLTGSGSNALFFDNLVVTIPEPSTNVALTLGVVGLVGMLRVRRQRA